VSRMNMKHTNLIHTGGRGALSVLSAGLLVVALGAPGFGQAPQDPQQYPAQAAPAGVQSGVPPQQQATQPLMPPQQLDDLVAPIALYPDPLLGQVLAASTYPLEVVEAGQWMQQNGNLHGQDLMNTARQQNWDPSVQALVAFPDVLTLLNRDVRWTTDLGNAFLAQQQDVMAAVQRMRVRAQANGRLSSNAQCTVSNQTQNGQRAVVIEPANPNYVYVPEYNPEYVWGPPAWGYYPPLWYPPVAFGFGFYPGIYMGGFFPGWGIGFGGWGLGLGWGWGLGWGGGGLFVNVGFFSHWGFHGYFGSGYAGGFGAGRAGWQHDPYHRAGVPYANRSVAARFNGSARFAEGRTARSNTFSGARGNSVAGTRGGFNGARGGGAATAGAAHGLAQNGLAQNRSAENRGGNASVASRGLAARSGGAGVNSAPRSFAASKYSTPRSSAGNAGSYSRAGFSAPRSSGGGGRSFGGGGGGHAFGGGGGGHASGGGGGHSSGGGGGHASGGGGGHSGGGGGHGGGRR